MAITMHLPEARIGDLLCSGAILEIQDGNHGNDHPTASEYVTSGVPFVLARDIVGGTVNTTTCAFITEERASRLRIGFAKPGDILITHKGSVGNVAICPDSYPLFVLTPQVTYYRVNSKKELLPTYLYQAFQSPTFQSELQVVSAQSTRSYVGITAQRHLKIPLPPLPEQQKIAAILSTWDRAIELTEKLIAAKQKRKQALMQQLLTGKVRFKEFEGKPWLRVPLGKLLKEVKRFVEWNDDAEYHLLSIRRRSGGMFDRETKAGHEIKTKVMMTTETEDFVIARMQAVHGAIAVTPPNCHGKHVSGSYSTFILKDPSKLHMPFLNYVSQTLAFYRLLLLSAYGVTIEKMTFNIPWFLSEKIDLPPTLEEQKRIASVFVAFDEENQLLLRRLERLKQQKKGLMQQLLTGKVCVNSGVQHV